MPHTTDAAGPLLAPGALRYTSIMPDAPSGSDRAIAAELAAEISAAGGHSTCHLRDLLTRFGRTRLTDAARDRLHAALVEVGIVASPPLATAARQDEVLLTLSADTVRRLAHQRAHAKPRAADTRRVNPSSGNEIAGLCAVDIAAFSFGALISAIVFDLDWILSAAFGAVFIVGSHLWWNTADHRKRQGALGAGILAAAIVLVLSTGVTQRLDREAERSRARQEAANRRAAVEAETRSLQLRLSERRSLVGVDLRGRDLGGFDLGGRDLSNAKLMSADLTDTYLYRTILRKADLRAADLSRAILSGADARDGSFIDTTFKGAELIDTKLDRALLISADLRAADFRHPQLTGARLYQANLTGAKLQGAKLRGAEFGGARLRRANLSGADMRDTRASVLFSSPSQPALGRHVLGADFRDADLTGVVLRRGDLSGADLRNSDLSRADLRWSFCQRYSNPALDEAIGRVGRLPTDLRGANLTDADLRGASLAGADLRGATVAGVKLAGALYDRTTKWPHDFNPVRAGASLVREPQPPLTGGYDLNEVVQVVQRASGEIARFGERLRGADLRWRSAP